MHDQVHTILEGGNPPSMKLLYYKKREFSFKLKEVVLIEHSLHIKSDED